jgi:alpha-L-fucosidase 2
MKRNVRIFLSMILVLTVVLGIIPVETAEADNGFDVRKYNLEWKTPSVKEDDSMPLGNGDVGLNLWMENQSDIVFYISKVGAYANNSTTMKLGKIRVALPANTFTNSDFSQTLDLSTGSIKITTGTGVNKIDLELWVDAKAPVIRLKGQSASEIPIEVSYELGWRNLTVLNNVPDNHAATEDVLLNDGGNAIMWYHRNSNSTWKNEAKSRHVTSAENLALDPIENLTFGGAIRAKGMQRASASKLSTNSTKEIDIVIDIHSDQPNKPQAFIDGLKQNMQKTDAVAYDDAYQDHVDWWEEYWDTSYIEITGGTFEKPKHYNLENGEDIGYIITQNYLLQRFIQGASMRGEHLVPFNGSIFNVNMGGIGSPDVRRWDGLPYMWQNTRAPYWSTLTSGDFEQTRTLIDNLYISLPVLKEHTMGRFGVEGAYLAEPMMPRGVPASAYTMSHLANHFAATVEIPLMMVRYYKFTGDAQLFKEKILPVTEACLDFLNNRYNKNDSNGKMIMYPANALETGIDSTNPTNTIAPMTALLDELLTLPGGLLTPAQIKKFVAMRNRMPDLPKSELNGVTFLAQEEKKSGAYLQQVESPQLYGVWPSSLYGPAVDSKDIDIARQTFSTRTRDWNLFGDTNQSLSTGGWNQGTLFAAKLALPYEASYLMTMCALNSVDDFDWSHPDTQGRLPARFPAFWGPYYDWIPDQCHGGNVTNALQMMLLQYDANNNIYLLPAWPEDWDVNFKLHGPKNTVVTGSYKNGKLDFSTNNGYSKIIDLSGYKERVINRVSVACADQNYLFKNNMANPTKYRDMPDGKFDETKIEKYVVTKDWFVNYGQSINGTVGTEYGWNDWGGVTMDREKGKVYFHLVNFDGNLTIPNYLQEIENPECLTKPGANVEVVQGMTNIQITMDPADVDPIDTIICMDTIVPSIIPTVGEAEWVNDNDSDIIYSAGWTHRTGRNYGEYQGDIHEGKGNNGETIEYTFTGTGIEVLATRGGGFGNLEIAVDGDYIQEVSLNYGAVDVQKTVYVLHGLEDKEHTITITSKATGGQYVTVDAFLVYQGEKIMVNDDDGRIKYSDGWTHNKNRGYGEYRDDIHLTSGPNGATATYEFYGTGIEVIATKGGGFASLEITVDDGVPEVVDMKSGTVVTQQPIYSKMDLEPGLHTVKVKSLSSQGNEWVALDAFRVTKPGQVKPSYITSIVQPDAVDADFGTAFGDLALPDKVEVMLKNNSKRYVNVDWNSDGYDKDSAGSYVLYGILKNLPDGVSNPLDICATIEVNVGLNPDCPNPRIMRLDNTDTVIEYDGAWVSQTIGGFDLYLNTQHYTTTNGDSFTITFTGTGIHYITHMDNTRGEVEVFVDDVSQGIVDCFRESSISQGVGFEILGLDYGTHTLKGVKKSGQYFTVDAIDIYNEYNGKDYITSVESFDTIGCKLGDVPDLPQTAEVTLNGKTKEELTVDWDMTGFDSSTPGMYTLVGTLVVPANSEIYNNSGLKARINVYVSETGLSTPDAIKVDMTLTEGKKGEAYTANATVLGGTPPYSYLITGLPTGLQAENNSITGTPTEAGTFVVGVLVKDSKNTFAFETFDLVIDPNYKVNSVTVSPMAIQMAKGSSQQFTAVVDGLNEPPQDVTWSVSGSKKLAELTSITENGMLVVASDEPNNMLTVKAVSNVDSTVSGTAQVTLIEGPVNTYDVTVTNGTGGGSFKAGAQVTIKANAAPAGKRFKGWIANPALAGVDLTQDPLMFTMPEYDVELTAVYEDVTGANYPIDKKHRNQKYTKRQKGDLVFRIDAPISKYLSTYIGRTKLREGVDVEVTEGSTVVTVKRAYLEKLTKGIHTLTVYFTDGYAITTFDILGDGSTKPGSKEGISKPPSAGDGSTKPGSKVSSSGDGAETQEIPVDTYDVTVVNGTGGGSIEVGAQVTIKADAAPEGKRFKSWIANPALEGVDLTQDPLVFTMPEYDVELTAVYEDVTDTEQPIDKEQQSSDDSTKPSSVEGSSDSGTKTKGESNLLLWIVLVAIVVASIGTILYLRKKKAKTTEE